MRAWTILGTVLGFVAGTQAMAAAMPTVVLESGADLELRLRETLARVAPGTVVELPEGRFSFADEVIVDVSHITLRGQGPERTILSFKNQKAGPQGILAVGDEFTLEDLAVEDTAGDGVKAAGIHGVTFRRVRVEWTGGPSRDNGGYGLYPVSARNVLVEDCEVIGASDSGVYVGQSENIIVRRNRTHGNVAGIEIENSRYADVTANDVTGNASGILVFDLPDLPRQGGRQTRVFANHVYDNNHKNFAAKGNILEVVPSGTGILVVANDDVQIFQNLIEDHKLTSVGVAHFAASQRPVSDPNYDPKPEKISIHDNRIKQRKHSFFDGNELNLVANILFKFAVPQILYDGIEDGTYEGDAPTAEQKICIRGNVDVSGAPSTFGNMHLDHQQKLAFWPGGPVTRDLAPHDCAHPLLPAVVLDPVLPLPTPVDPVPGDEVERLCSAPGEGVNWEALAKVDCPRFSDYRLFKSPGDPTKRPEDGGFPYDLSAPLFSDHAVKHRFVFLPAGTAAEYRQAGPLEFPLGAAITKTFSFPRVIDDPSKGNRIVETRVMVRREAGWHALPYVWRDNMSDADLALGGSVKEVRWIAANGKRVKIDYNLPSQSKCAFCHSGTQGMNVIGPKAKFLNRDFVYGTGVENQLAYWARTGALSGLPAEPGQWPKIPAWNDPKSGSIEARTRGYLDVNCAHCHNPTGRARNTGLYLESERDPKSTAYGICKPPIAAGQGSGGYLYDIVPGKAKESVLVFRLASDHVAVRMPEEGRSVLHKEGLDLVKDWVNSLPKKKCE